MAASSLGWDPLKTRREKHIIKLVKNRLDGQAPSYFSDYSRQRTCDIHDYYTRCKDKLSIDKVNLELTNRAFFYKGAIPFLMIVFIIRRLPLLLIICNVYIPVSKIVFFLNKFLFIYSFIFYTSSCLNMLLLLLLPV